MDPVAVIWNFYLHMLYKPKIDATKYNKILYFLLFCIIWSDNDSLDFCFGFFQFVYCIWRVLYYVKFNYEDESKVPIKSLNVDQMNCWRSSENILNIKPYFTTKYSPLFYDFRMNK